MFFSVVPRRLWINPNANSGYVSEIGRTWATADSRGIAGARLRILQVIQVVKIIKALVDLARHIQRTGVRQRAVVGTRTADHIRQCTWPGHCFIVPRRQLHNAGCSDYQWLQEQPL
ncbi:MAG: hypothetical protein OR999_09890, partial [Arenicellales bacterium]|nr:hypothetical protein [Arenicellales bacterium]